MPTAWFDDAEPAQPPDYAAANREAILADIETLPLRRQIEAAARAGDKITYTDPRDGKEKTADFTGLGEGDVSQKLAETLGPLARTTAQAQLDVGREFAPQFIALAREGMQQADPEGFAARQRLAERLMSEAGQPGIEENPLIRQGREAALRNVLEEFQLGNRLSDAESRNLEQQVRGAQAARGNVFGNAPSVQEIGEKFNLGERKYQQRLSNLMNVGAQAFGQEQAFRQEGTAEQQRRMANLSQFATGAPLSAFFQTLQGAQQGAAPFQPVQAQGMPGVNPNAGQLGTQFAAQNYATFGPMAYEANIYNQPSSRWGRDAQNFSTTVSAASSAAGMFCWVAREVYGEENPRWMQFRSWMLEKAPESLREWYVEYGPAFAEVIRGDEHMKGIVRNWMESKLA